MTPSRAADSLGPGSKPLERRRHQRVRVALLGRYMLANRQEFPCQTVDMSPGGALMIAPVRGTIGERVIAYLEHVGRVEGTITRLVDQGFAFAFAATPRKRDKIASQLTWLANRSILGLPEDRRHERVVPRNPFVTLKFESGPSTNVQLIDVSISGAAISVANRPPVGTAVLLGRTPGKVMRHLPEGVAVEFLLPLSPDRFDEGLEL